MPLLAEILYKETYTHVVIVSYTVRHHPTVIAVAVNMLTIA